MHIDDLISLGLSEKEARVYMTLLSLKDASANEIANKSNIKRSSAYVVLETLQKRGLVGISNDASNIRRYVASSPKVLVNTANEEYDTASRNLKRIQEISPELLALHKDVSKSPKVKVFEGQDGIKVSGTVYDIITLWAGYLE